MFKLAAALAVLAVVVPHQALAQQTLTVCVVGTGDAANCAAWYNEALGEGSTFQVQCVYRANEDACLDAIGSGAADLVRGGGDMVFKASQPQYNFVAYAAENYGAGAGVSYFGVAVVKAEYCQANNNAVTLSSLRGKKMCTTGYRRTAGWTLPVGFMVDNDIMNVVSNDANVNNDAESIAAYFSTVCAPGTTNGAGNNAGPRRTANSQTGARWDPLCSGCGIQNCSSNSEYGDYEGALRCMIEGSGDVAFVRHTTPFDYERNRGGINAENDLRLVCKDDTGCAPVSAWSRCSYAAAPAHAFVGRRNLANAPQLASRLATASSSATWLQDGQQLGLITANAEEIDTLGPNGAAVDIQTYMGSSSFGAFQAIRTLQAETQTPINPPAAGPLTGAVRVCVGSSTLNQAECDAWYREAFNGNTQVTCVLRANEDACLEAIRNGQADIVRGGGDMVFKAKAEYNYDAFLAEDYGVASGVSYFGVAVVKKEYCDARNNDVRLSDLRGRSMCTTGYRRTAGWTLPVGFMVTTGLMPVVSNDPTIQDDAETVANYFGQVCAPGTTNGPNNNAGPRREGSSPNGANWDELCVGCTVAGKNCSGNSEYGDYEGALRCMVEGNGDVAFVRHSTPADYERNQAGRAWWTRASDLRLVCADNSGCAETTAYDRAGCSYARAPAHAFVGLSSFANGPAFAAGLAAKSAAGDSAAWLSAGKRLGLISNNAVRLVTTRAGGAATNIVDYITPTSFAYFRAVRDLQQAAEAVPQRGGGGNDLSDGAIAGIVIGCVCGTALIAGVIALIIVRRQKTALWDKFASTNNVDLNAKFSPTGNNSAPAKTGVATSYQV